jgi:adenine-specific DNA-methyltransferase
MSSQKNYSEQDLLVRISELETEIKHLKKQKKYGLVWEDHTEDVVLECQENIPTLKEVKNRKIVDKDITKTTNLLIEGDNYHTLSVLNYTHKGKVDVIYIDPPYNTGNKDFVYNDSFVDKDNSYRHSKWLSFMEKRLRLSKGLLSENGIIFISIDDNEFSQLKLLSDDIFGYENYINSFIWINNLKGRQISDFGASKTYEYILVYAKNSKNISSFDGDMRILRELCPDMYKSKDYEIFEDSLGKYVIKNELYNTNSEFNEITRPNLVFDIFYNPKTEEVKFIESKGYVKISPKINNNGTHTHQAWRWSKEKIEKESYNLFFEKSGNTYKIYTKIRDIYTTTIKDVITNIATNSGGTELKEILGKKSFNFPKPRNLVEYLCKFST